MNDIRGNPVSCSDARALEAYEAALLSFQTYVGDPVAIIDGVLAERPDFFLGHVFRAVALMAMGERRWVVQAKKSLADADALCTNANDREKGLAAAADRFVAGEWSQACAIFEEVLTAYPRDIFATQTAQLLDFYRGDALNLRNRISRVLPSWDAAVPGYSYLLGMHAFGLEECNQYADAEATGRRALELQPRDAWAVHAVTHVMEMTGRVEDGISWLEGRRNDWAPHNGFAFHNFWHLALFHLDLQQYDAVRALYDENIYAKPHDACVVMVDATSLLWRLHLEGESIGNRASVLADAWQKQPDSERGYYAFNDVHAAMALCLAGDIAQGRRLVQQLEGVARDGAGDNRAMTNDVGLPFAQAIVAFADGDYSTAIARILPMRDRACTFGGSHAQRDVITLTLIEAALRTRQHSLARHLIAERTVQKPRSNLGWRLRARTES
jgi:tetratricopeptide (TPR) repeat protein